MRAIYPADGRAICQYLAGPLLLLDWFVTALAVSLTTF